MRFYGIEWGYNKKRTGIWWDDDDDHDHDHDDDDDDDDDDDNDDDYKVVMIDDDPVGNQCPGRPGTKGGLNPGLPGGNQSCTEA